MKEIKCPKCGNVFSVDEADYAAIVTQVRNAEFDAEIQRRMNEVQERHKTEQELATEKAKQTFQTQLNQKELELGNKDAEIERLKSEKDSEIARLKSQLGSIEVQKKSELTTALAEKDREIAALNSTISQSEGKLQLAVMEERNKAQQTVQAKETEIAQLRSAVELEKREAQIHEASLKKQHEVELRMKQEEVDYYRDLKTKLNTKMVGETLEQHCEQEFNKLRSLFRGVYFEKDNDVVDGTKGDYIYRETDNDGIEIISIMFEMKNEMETTAAKHKNESFFKKLDEDRKKKNCEYAVLVSLLENDSDLYNQGIVDVSYRYEKMYVIRPQFFIPMITILRNAALNSMKYKRQLSDMQNQEIDITNFEKKLENFKKDFSERTKWAKDRFDDAIKEIDKSIESLQQVKKDLQTSFNHLKIADSKTNSLLTIRNLTDGNETMTEMFNALKDGEA